MKLPRLGAWLVVITFAIGTHAFAQGGGASSTGTIQGRITDAQGAVLPGVTVTATSTSLLGAQTTASSETGNYRFPAVPPGVYALSFELSGFNALKRDGVQISLGFTANLNVELSLATVQETVTVSGSSPIIDTTATRTVQNFKLDQLQSIPNARDMWALLAVTPSVQMSRIDVGGNRAGTQTGYTAYGFNGQVRVLIEGINTTEGTGGAGFYFDYSSLEEVFLGTSGQSAEMPNPGVQSQFIAKSGGNRFSGEGYLDWYNNSLQGSNIPDSYTVPTAFNNNPIRAHSNEIDRYYNYSLNVGGPVVHDRVWWFGTYNKQFNAVAQPNFNFDSTFDTMLWNAVGKGTFQANSKNKFIGYYQWGQKLQPNRLPFSTAIYNSPDATYKQDSGSWVWKGEWNGTLSDKLYVEARYGDFGYYFPTL
ncbi:MAG: carboxypeptidase-like regulatory domain-containing protein, partial [Vicinamibacterales bacterium]